MVKQPHIGILISLFTVQNPKRHSIGPKIYFVYKTDPISMKSITNHQHLHQHHRQKFSCKYITKHV